MMFNKSNVTAVIAFFLIVVPVQIHASQYTGYNTTTATSGGLYLRQLKKGTNPKMTTTTTTTLTTTTTTTTQQVTYTKYDSPGVSYCDPISAAISKHSSVGYTLEKCQSLCTAEARCTTITFYWYPSGGVASCYLFATCTTKTSSRSDLNGQIWEKRVVSSGTTPTTSPTLAPSTSDSSVTTTDVATGSQSGAKGSQSLMIVIIAASASCLICVCIGAGYGIYMHNQGQREGKSNADSKSSDLESGTLPNLLQSKGPTSKHEQIKGPLPTPAVPTPAPQVQCAPLPMPAPQVKSESLQPSTRPSTGVADVQADVVHDRKRDKKRKVTFSLPALQVKAESLQPSPRPSTGVADIQADIAHDVKRDPKRKLTKHRKKLDPLYSYHDTAPTARN